MIYLIHILRWFRKFLIFPKQCSKLFFEDLKIDKLNRKKKHKNKFILIIGLPKSGTTLIEKILRLLGYVDQSTSPLRIFDNRNLSGPHDLSENMLKRIPKNKFSFLKLHIHFSEKNLELIKKYNPKVIISFRNIKDVLISRYTHILSDDDHRHHKQLKKLDVQEGFMQSLIIKNSSDTPIKPVEYFFYWIKNWHENIEKYKLNYLKLNFEEFKLDKSTYINKILRYLDIYETDTKKILNELDRDNKKMKSNKLKNNLKQYLKPQTLNNDKKISNQLDTEEIENFILNNLPK